VKRGAEHIALDDPLLARLGEVADEQGLEAYVVGGYVRDSLLGKGDNDVDVVVVGDGVAFARCVAARLGISRVVAYEKFGTAMVPLERRKLEFVGARKERYRSDSRKPEVKGGTLVDDLRRRDFTVNAIAASLSGARFGELMDPLDGASDLQEGILRTPLDPVTTFEDDPLRMLRAARFAAQLEFRIEETALRAIHAMRGRLSIVSQERITEEFLKTLATGKPSVGLRLMQDTGMMETVFPEVAQLSGVDQIGRHHHKDVFSHTCLVVDNVAGASDNLWLRFGALVHDIAKPQTKAFREGAGWTFHGHEELGARMMKRIFRRMRLPMGQLSYVEKLVRLHLRPMVLVDETVTDSAVRRLVFEAGEQIEDLMTLCRADITSKNPSLVSRYLRNYENVMKKVVEVIEKDRLRQWQPPVRGDEIMAVCGLQPGPKVGLLKKAIEEAILDGRIPNEHDAALEYLLSKKGEILGQ
jgi:putative nucleotidyltransferase with HDIG domain